jgi:hypothetical protein
VAHPQIAIFARLAKGGDAPVRRLEGQATKLGRNTHDIRYDAVHDEIVVGNNMAQSILTFRGAASEEEAPVRVIQGPHTEIQMAERAEVDPIHNEIIIAEDESILIYPRTGAGDVAPIRTIKGPDTKLLVPRALAVDPVHDLIVVSVNGLNSPKADPRDRGALLIFNRTDKGNVKPRTVIAGPRTQISSIEPGVFSNINMLQVYPPKGWIVATHSSDARAEENFIGIWSVNDNGDAPPRFKLGGTQTTLLRARGVVLDPKHKEVIVEDTYWNALLAFHLPEIF